jgi:hypothetical protein
VNLTVPLFVFAPTYVGNIGSVLKELSLSKNSDHAYKAKKVLDSLAKRGFIVINQFVVWFLRVDYLCKGLYLTVSPCLLLFLLKNPAPS